MSHHHTKILVAVKLYRCQFSLVSLICVKLYRHIDEKILTEPALLES